MAESKSQISDSGAVSPAHADAGEDLRQPIVTCGKCGAPALVHISNGSGQATLMRHLCLDCAAAEDNPVPRERALNHAAIFFVVGLFTLGLSIVADVLRLGAASNFGIRQLASTALALVLITAGAIVRIPTIAVVGAMMGGIAILADLIGMGMKPGFGFKQIAGCLLGGVFIAIGLALSRRRT